MTHRTKTAVLVTTFILALIAAISASPIPQDLAFHDFADTRALFGIPRFGDVASNFPFLLVGSAGILALLRRKADPKLHRPALWAIFGGLALTAWGSAYYHWAPDNSRLFWDRLPLTLVFMGLFALILSDRVNPDLGKKLLWPLLGVGAFSVIYWDRTEQAGQGDLRLYLFVQFYPMVAIPLCLAMFRGARLATRTMMLVFAFYAGAKGLELADKAIYALGGWISGHTLKHLSAGVATFFIYKMVSNPAQDRPSKQRPVPSPEAVSRP